MYRFFFAVGLVLLVGALAVLGLTASPYWGAAMMAAVFILFLIGGFLWEEEQISKGFYLR